MSRRGSIPLWLDHASVAVPVLAQAIDHLNRRLGLHATLSPAEPDRHSRIYLHRSYLEVASAREGAPWGFTHFFLRFDDPETLRSHLEAAHIPAHFGVYDGVDGRWDDVEITGRSVPLPILVRRTDPPDLARRWPPPLARPHRCGARSLAAVHLGVPQWEPAVDLYHRLLGTDGTTLTGGGRRRLSLPLSSGMLVLSEDATAGVTGVVLGVESLQATRSALGPWLTSAEDDVAWLDSAVTFGLRFGFVQDRG